MALPSTVSRSNWNLEMFVFVEGGKPEYPEKNPRSREENQQQTQPNPHMTLRPGIELGPHWWEASALTTAPSLLPHIPYTFYIPYCRTNLQKFSIRFQGPTLFNSLSREIQNSESISLAKFLLSKLN